MAYNNCLQEISLKKKIYDIIWKRLVIFIFTAFYPLTNCYSKMPDNVNKLALNVI